MFGSTLSRLFTCTTGGLLLLQLACGSISSKSFGDGSAGTGGTETGGSFAGGGGGAGATGGSAGGAGGATSTGGAAGGAGGAAAGAGGSSLAGAGGTPAGGSHGGAAGGAAGVAGGGGGAKATGGAGGAAGGAGGAGPTCASLEMDYTNAVNSAKSCTASGTCAVKISRTICGCSGCPSTTYISDATAANAVKTQWQQLGCKCPAIYCIVCPSEPTSATCDSILLTAAAPIGGGGIISLPRTCTDH